MIFYNLMISAAIMFTAAPEPPCVHVLCYHAFKPTKNEFCFSIDELKSHIKFYKDNGFRFVSMSDVVSGRIIGNKNILITVDDGNKSVFEAYTEVFKPNGIRPVIGIYPAIIDRKDYALTWKQLKYLADNGCDVAAHGYNHLILNKKLYNKDRKAFNREIFHAKKVLEEKLGRQINLYVYPFGVRSEETIDALKEAGIKYAFTIVNGGMVLPISRNYNSLELPRYMITRNNWKGSFKRITSNILYKYKKHDLATAAVTGDPDKKLASAHYEKKQAEKARPENLPKMKEKRAKGQDSVRKHVLLDRPALPDLKVNDRESTGKTVMPIIEARSGLLAVKKGNDDKSKDGKAAPKDAQEKAAKPEKKAGQSRLKTEYRGLTLDSYHAYNKFMDSFRGRIQGYGYRLSDILKKNFTD
ncbi:MAG: polysaccharide deacetylase family protein [Spirochaetes bacterium]|nr:polysaccharide deacetylase family protein [Spirochaetota bacterium]